MGELSRFDSFRYVMSMDLLQIYCSFLEAGMQLLERAFHSEECDEMRLKMISSLASRPLSLESIAGNES
jgi:hypothetical protein